jgi:hypothetical protein
MTKKWEAQDLYEENYEIPLKNIKVHRVSMGLYNVEQVPNN